MAIGFQDLGSVQRTPDKSFSKKVKPTVLKIQFGDGYEQRVAEGINSLKETFSVGFTNRPKAEIDDIVAFFDNKKGTTVKITIKTILMIVFIRALQLLDEYMNHDRYCKNFTKTRSCIRTCYSV